MTVFLRVLEPAVDEKAGALLRAVSALNSVDAEQDWLRSIVFEHESGWFSAVPGSPFAYWLSGAVVDLFSKLQPFNDGTRVTRVGLGTLDDFRFLRLWPEPDQSTLGCAWMPLANGGAFSRFYGDIPQVIFWHNSGNCLKTFVEAKVGSASRKIQSEDYYYRAGITWPLRAKAFCPQALPSKSIFSARGYAAFVRDSELLAFIALGSSSMFDALFKIMLGRFGFPEFLVGVLGRVPVPNIDIEAGNLLTHWARRAWLLKRALDSTNETSYAFLLPSGLNEKRTLRGRDAVESELESIQEQIDAMAFALYRIGPEDRAAIEAASKRAASSDRSGEEDVEDEGDDASEDEAPVDAGAGTLSWLVGVAFGRFDPRLATGERVIPPEPEPFDPLPSRSPGMYPAGEDPPSRADILVDDEGHGDDLTARSRAVAERVQVNVPENLRTWLAKEFFPLHIKMYSKSRRKAPIYWQLATPSASYSVWLYIHAFSKDTLFRVQNDFAAPKLAHEEKRLEALANELRDRATGAQRRELATQETVVEELRAFLEEVKRVAPLWDPNLDDGVIINFAPLWRLVPQNKSWQKELKSTWDALGEGKYDWAHLAMNLWPERVVPKCAKDRSLAIAHGLEDVFWVESSDGKWAARKAPTRSVAELVRERTSPAVKSALKSLLEAPSAVGAAKKTKKGKADA